MDEERVTNETSESVEGEGLDLKDQVESSQVSIDQSSNTNESLEGTNEIKSEDESVTKDEEPERFLTPEEEDMIINKWGKSVCKCSFTEIEGYEFEDGDRPLEYNKYIPEFNFNDTLVDPDLGIISMKEVYSSHNKYKSFLYERALLTNDLRMYNYELMTCSINVYNEILMEELSNEERNDTILSVFLYKLGFLISKFVKRTSHYESHVVSTNMLITIFNNLSKGIIIDNPYRYMTSILRFRFYDMLDKDYCFRNRTNNIIYSDDLISSHLESQSPSYEGLTAKLQSRFIFSNLMDIIREEFDKVVKFRKITEEYMRLLRDVDTNLLDHIETLTDLNSEIGSTSPVNVKTIYTDPRYLPMLNVIINQIMPKVLEYMRSEVDSLSEEPGR